MACFAEVSFQDGNGSFCAEAWNDQPKLTVTPRIALANTVRNLFFIVALRENPAGD
jgi:hypothetical protein